MATILERIAGETGVGDIAEILGERLAFADLQSLLHEVYRRRAARRTPAQVLAEYERGRLFGPGADALALLDIRRRFSGLLSGDFECVDLSPLTPLATTSSVAPISPDWSIAALHGAEMSSDPTNVLALEAAVRRKRLLAVDPKAATQVHLAAMQRVVRPQRYADPGALAHFTLLGLVSAGRDRGSLSFEAEAAARHIEAHIQLLRAYLGPDAILRLTFTTAGNEQPIIDAIAAVAASHDIPRVEEPGRDVEAYYKRFCFHLFAGWDADSLGQLCDGGLVDWTAKLLGNAKERLMTSGMGLEFLPHLKAARPI